MKLTHKLTLSFLIVSLIVIGLAAVFVWATTSIEFNNYLMDQRQAEFVAVATNYYQTHGGWLGVDSALREKGLLPPFVKPGDPPPDPQPFALIDQTHTVIVPSGTYQAGQKIQSEALSKGVNIKINGVVVGTIMTAGRNPARKPIENKYLASVNRSLLIAALGGAAIAFLLGLLIARSLAHPIRDLTTATRSMAQGKLEQQVPVRSKDELGELAQAFNQMSADLARANQSRRQMTADIAHDLRNPLTVIGGYLESLKDGKLKPTPERFETMQAEVQHLQRLVDDLRTLSLADAGELKLSRQMTAPGELLECVAAAYRHQAEQQKINLKVEVEPNLPEINIDPERMEQALGNLVSNALRYTPEGGKILLSAKQPFDRPQDKVGVILAVEDNGSGISPDILPHIFERSYRGDPSRSGDESGLGLAITRSIVELHGGSISVTSSPGRGSRFFIAI